MEVLAAVVLGIAAGIFGMTSLGGLGGVAFMSQLIGTVGGAAVGLVVGLVIYGVLKAIMGIRLTPEEERRGADLSIHRIGANPEGDIR